MTIPSRKYIKEQLKSYYLTIRVLCGPNLCSLRALGVTARESLARDPVSPSRGGEVVDNDDFGRGLRPTAVCCYLGTFRAG